MHSVTSLLCPVMVGRVYELHALDLHLDGEGPPALVFSGEAGIGKSRLIVEARRRALERGAQVLQGSCYEPDRVLPYAPLLDLLRGMRVMDADMESLRSPGQAAQELARLLPGLLTAVPAAVTPLTADPQEHQRRVFFAVTDLLLGLAPPAQLLVIVEDLHWSDETSLELLSYVGRHTRDRPIRFLLSYRSDESNPALSHFLANLERERLAMELPLSRLGPEQVGAMVRAILGGQVPREIVHLLYRLTDGNPFFVEEALKSLVELGDLTDADERWRHKPAEALRVPRTVQDAVQRRAATLSQAARRVLEIAAVAGRQFDFALLQHLTGSSAAGLLSLIRELIAHQLVVEESADRFAFRHALTREAIYADLLARERRDLHRTIAMALEELSSDALSVAVADLAYHYAAAGVWQAAQVYSQQAGEQALAMYAPHAAVEHFTRALQACDRLAVPAPVALYHGRGSAHEMLGLFERACADYEMAQRIAREAGDQQDECEALLDLALLWSGRDYARVGDFVQRSLEIAREAGDPLMLARSLNRLGNWYTNVERPREGLACHREALDIFERQRDRRGVAETLDFLGMAGNLAADHAQSAAYYERALPLLEEIDDRQRLVISLTMWMLQSGLYFSEAEGTAYLDSVAAERRGERALAMARAMDWPAGEAFVLYEQALWLGPRGRYARALECAHSALTIAEEIGHQQWLAGSLCALGALHLDLLDAPAARRHLERALEAAQELGSVLWTRVATSFLVPTYLLQGEQLLAATVLDAAIEQETPMETIMQRLCWRARAQLALARGEAASALEIIDRLIASAAPEETESQVASRQAQPVVPGLWKLRAEALLPLGRTAEAEEVLRQAAKVAVAQGSLPLVWRIHLVLGRVLQSRGRRGEARQAFAMTRAVVQELAENLPDEPLRSGFLRQAMTLLPPLRPVSPGRAAKERFGGLTAREREVAIRVAQGKSNRAIAEELVVTERTVEGYVGNILGKLAFGSRAQIAAWAVEKGLGGSEKS